MMDYRELAWSSDEKLAFMDIAFVNAACAAGLPGVERFDPSLIIDRLDYWARHCLLYTARMLPQFRRKRYDYKNSEAYFRVLCMVTALQRDLGLRYNPDKIPTHVPLEPVDSFIHGAVLGQGGTCASIPVVLVAVGRRLDYPLRLVWCLAPEEYSHLFARWDGPDGERFNIEATNTGLFSPPDEYYREGPYQRTREYEEAGQLLQSMTRRDELAGFLSERACHWRFLGERRRAAEAFAYAAALAPANRFYLNMLKMVLNDWTREQERTKPPGSPPLFPKEHGRRFPEGLPLEIERHILAMEALDNALRDSKLNQLYWEPMRHGVRPARVPVRIDAMSGPNGCNLTVT